MIVIILVGYSDDFEIRAQILLVALSSKCSPFIDLFVVFFHFLHTFAPNLIFTACYILVSGVVTPTHNIFFVFIFYVVCIFVFVFLPFSLFVWFCHFSV